MAVVELSWDYLPAARQWEKNAVKLMAGEHIDYNAGGNLKSDPP